MLRGELRQLLLPSARIDALPHVVLVGLHGHHRLVVVDASAMQQPGQRGVFVARRSGPGRYAVVLGTGERHIEKPQLLGAILHLLAVMSGIVRVEVQHLDVAAFLGLVVLRGGASARTAPEPGERIEHDRKLQALAAMHGDHLHQPLVALEAQLRSVVAVLRIAAPAGEPLHQRRRFKPLAGFRLLQQIRQVQHVGEAARPPWLAQQGRRAMRWRGEQQTTNQRRHAHAAPSRPPFLEALLPRFPNAILGKRRRFFQRQPEHAGRQRAAQGRGFAMRRNAGKRLQQTVQLLGLVGVEDIHVAELHALHPAFAQRPRHLLALGAGAHQHGDVAAAQRLASDGCPPVGACFKQPGDFRSRALGRDALHVAFAGRVAASLPAPFSRVQAQQQGGALLVVDPQAAARIAGGLDGLEGEFMQQKGTLAREQGVHGLHETGRGAVVGAEAHWALALALAHLQEREQVRATEAVDGLLGVADDGDALRRVR